MPRVAQELIKVKGNQVAPAELEALLLEHPSIADAAVVGVVMYVTPAFPFRRLLLRIRVPPSPSLTHLSASNGDELPRAYVVAGAGGVEPQAVAAFMAERVAPHKRLAGGVVVVDAIAKNPVSVEPKGYSCDGR